MCLTFKQERQKRKVGAKTNVQRIAQKMEEIMVENNVPAQESWMFLTDILRLQVFCNSHDEVIETFFDKMLPRATAFQIVRLKPRFNTPLKDMIVNFNMNNKGIFECQIKLGQSPRGYGEQHFIYECIRTVKARSVGLLFDCITKQVNWCFHNDRFIYDTDINKSAPVPISLQKLLIEEGHDVKNYRP